MRAQTEKRGKLHTQAVFTIATAVIASQNENPKKVAKLTLHMFVPS
jgi:hypothetical protein